VNAASTTYAYPGTSHKLSALSGATTRSFTYDNAGNVTASQAISYVYDGRGRMKQAGSTTYVVNGLGQRVKKNSGSDLFFAYDEAGHLIGEYDATGAAIEETLWLGDMPVAVVKPAIPTGSEVFYIWADHLGTSRQITDALDNSRWEWPNGDPFGNSAPNENPSGLGIFTYNLRFPGQYFDAEKGSSYNYFRDYDPSIGRYVQSDPLGLEAGLNTYGYVDADPLRKADPTGENTIVLGAGAGFSLGGPPGAIVGGLIGGAVLVYGICKAFSNDSDCKKEIEDCSRICTEAQNDPQDRRHVYGGSMQRCMKSCLPERCGGDPKWKGYKKRGRSTGR
jgi:RHS repeat-associated protein